MYTGLAVSNAPKQVAQLLDGRFDLNQSPDHFTQFDWNLQHTLTLLSDNPVFIMILNGFEALYLNLAPFYFAIPAARQRSLDYYENLADAAEKEDVFSARTLTEEIMRDSLNFWQQTKFL
jgi:GntR family negative regulator for fad regulon and positive regulator of fabA